MATSAGMDAGAWLQFFLLAAVVIFLVGCVTYFVTAISERARRRFRR